jgi:hypothetical protein
MAPLTSGLTNHAYALAVSGYTAIPHQIQTQELKDLQSAADLALEAEQRTKNKQPYTLVTDYYKAVRCMYCWDNAYLRLLEHPTIHALASLLIGQYQLWDLSLLSALPTPDSAASPTTAWHRDFQGVHRGTEIPGYLWFFVCLDDFTPKNGATWVVPGSHQINSIFEPNTDACKGNKFDQFPSRLQLSALAGDLLVLDPTILHTSGRNESARPRRLINVAICHRDKRPLMNHWSMPALRFNPMRVDKYVPCWARSASLGYNLAGPSRRLADRE